MVVKRDTIEFTYKIKERTKSWGIENVADEINPQLLPCWVPDLGLKRLKPTEHPRRVLAPCLARNYGPWRRRVLHFSYIMASLEVIQGWLEAQSSIRRTVMMLATRMCAQMQRFGSKMCLETVEHAISVNCIDDKIIREITILWWPGLLLMHHKLPNNLPWPSCVPWRPGRLSWGHKSARILTCTHFIDPPCCAYFDVIGQLQKREPKKSFAEPKSPSYQS